MTDSDFFDSLDDAAEEAPPGVDGDQRETGKGDEPVSDKMSTPTPGKPVTPPTKKPQTPAASPEKKGRLYADVEEFVVKWLGSVISRKLSTQSGGGLRWDPEWWKYPEVVFRMQLMWSTFEVARSSADPAKLETWARTVLDHHLGIILNGSIGPMNAAGGPMPPLGATYSPKHPKREAHEALLRSQRQQREHKAQRERAERAEQQQSANAD